MLEKEYYRHLPANLLNSYKGDRMANLTLLKGAHGLISPSSVTPHTKFVYPMFQPSNLKEKMSTELAQFIDAHDKIIMIGFGSSFLPTNETF